MRGDDLNHSPARSKRLFVQFRGKDGECPTFPNIVRETIDRPWFHPSVDGAHCPDYGVARIGMGNYKPRD
jgi:hypothetical protein